MPTTVQVGPRSYTVEVDDAAVNAEAAAIKAELDGFSIHNAGRILIRPKLAPDYEAEIVLHELVHAVNDLVGLALDNDEEARTRAQAPALLDVLRRNPDLVAYLMGP